MLKNIAAAIICFTLIFAAAVKENDALIFKNADYYIFTNTTSSGGIKTASPKQAAKVKESLKGAGGEAAVYFSKSSAEEIIKKYNAEVLFTETIAGITNYYCFSKNINDALYINGKKINLHISVAEGRITAGSPIIFSSY